MSSRLAVLLVLAACAPLAQAEGGRATMAVSATVVNTCFFGQQARCHLAGTSVRVQSERPAGEGGVPLRQRIVHL
ncbi:MAG: hypothetical protein EOO24_21185 [Comamonadaceae bacterium]|nr:MAG: hypothetical protein EOO24_21185 [Comamonadaceae bacterium]